VVTAILLSLQKEGIEGEIPQLPSVEEYEKWLNDNAEQLGLQPRHIASTLRDYERSDIKGKLYHAKEMWDMSGPNST